MKTEKLNKSYNLLTDSGKLVGSFQLDSNGEYYFWEDLEVSGCWSANNLREIANELDKVNKPLRNSIEECFKQENEKRDICEHDFILIEDFCGISSFACKNCGFEIADFKH